MAVKLKKVKPMVVITLPEILTIKSKLNAFRIGTRGDMQRLDEINAFCESVEKTRLETIESFKTEKGLAKDVQIDEQSVFYGELYNRIMTKEVEISADALAKFSPEELDFAVDGGIFSYGERKLLEKWLAKSTK